MHSNMIHASVPSRHCGFPLLDRDPGRVGPGGLIAIGIALEEAFMAFLDGLEQRVEAFRWETATDRCTVSDRAT